MRLKTCRTPAVLPVAPGGPLYPYIEPFAESLLERGYSAATAKHKIQLLRKLDQWLDRRRIGIEQLGEDTTESFLGYIRGRGRNQHADPSTVRYLLGDLREAGVIPSPVVKHDVSPIYRTQTRFAEYLVDERGLSQSTVRHYTSELDGFLWWCFPSGAISLRDLSSADITQWVLHRARTVSPHSAQCTRTGLRSFLQFLHQRGEIAMNLAASIPPVANWTLALLPKYLTPADIELVLNTCKTDSAQGRRDLAVLLLLARLGLRAGEVVGLRLQDIDWNAGELTTRGKGGREDRLPIPVNVGKALATYLRHSRPSCVSQRVFLRLCAPHQGFAGSSIVTVIFQRALKCAGLNSSYRGAHLLRHSLDTRMLRGGASLAEIGGILRHRLPKTTAIYTKVDLAALRALAQPWLGGES
jgi:integrase/recombinase XerD